MVLPLLIEGLMKILVTGAAGFVAFHLIHKLLKDGHSVVGIDNMMSGQLRNVEDLATEYPTQFAFLRADVNDLLPQSIEADPDLASVFDVPKNNKSQK